MNDDRNDPFAVLRTHEGTASRWQLSRYVLGELEATEVAEVERSLAACAHCREVVDREREEVADRWHPIPPRILEADREVSSRPRGWRRLRWPVLGVPALALSLAAVWMAVPETMNPSTTRRKGAAIPSETGMETKHPIALAVKRGDRIVVREAPVQEVTLRVGDRVRLKIPSELPWVRVEAHDAAEGPLFEGWRPADGWLPMALLLTDAEPTRLTIQTCVAANREPCETRTVRLQGLR